MQRIKTLRDKTLAYFRYIPFKFFIYFVKTVYVPDEDYNVFYKSILKLFKAFKYFVGVIIIFYFRNDIDRIIGILDYILIAVITISISIIVFVSQILNNLDKYYERINESKSLLTWMNQFSKELKKSFSDINDKTANETLLYHLQIYIFKAMITGMYKKINIVQGDDGYSHAEYAIRHSQIVFILSLLAIIVFKLGIFAGLHVLILMIYFFEINLLIVGFLSLTSFISLVSRNKESITAKLKIISDGVDYLFSRDMITKEQYEKFISYSN